MIDLKFGIKDSTFKEKFDIMKRFVQVTTVNSTWIFMGFLVRDEKGPSSDTSSEPKPTSKAPSMFMNSSNMISYVKN